VTIISSSSFKREGLAYIRYIIIRYLLKRRPYTLSSLTVRDDNGSAGHGSRVKWVNKSEWVTWVRGQYS